MTKTVKRNDSDCVLDMGKRAQKKVIDFKMTTGKKKKKYFQKTKDG